MAEPTVRVLESVEELTEAARLVARQMLGSVTDEASAGWAELKARDVVHGAFAEGELVGSAQYFRSRLTIPGGQVPAAAVTAVAVLSNHRRQGHLTRLIEAELRHAADAGLPVAVLLAAEYPIYGRFGYGPATRASELELDLKLARFRDEPTGTITMTEPAELRGPLQEAYELRRARTPGAIERDDLYWDFAAGCRALPGRPLDVGLQRGAVWHDADGRLGGAVVYKVEEVWTRGRPLGTIEVEHLYGATAEAERELWRHLTTVDWAAVAKVEEGRPVDEGLPLWLHDGRAAVSTRTVDNLWLRLLDLPAAMAARRSAVAGAVVLEVGDHLGYVDGRWAVELGPDAGSAAPTTAAPDLRLSAATLAAAFLGGYTLAELAEVGRVEEAEPGTLAAASALLATSTAPWCPLDF